MKKIILLALAFSLVSCVSDDPRQGGFFGGVLGLSNGTYDKRIADRQQSLASVRNTQQELQTENARLQRQKRASISEIKRAQRQLASVRRENRSIRNNIAELRRSNKITSQQAQKMSNDARRLEQSIETQSSRLSRAQRNNDATELARVQAQINALRRQQKEQARMALIMAQ